MKLLKTLKSQKGFTLIELLVVIGILAVLLAITLIAINPSKQFSQANNTKRRSDVNAILNAVDQYLADFKILPSAITETSTEISNEGVNICSDIVPTYIAALPVDPQTNGGASIAETDCTGTYSTGYTISKSATNNRITVSAAAIELGDQISVTR
jgi:prepilin-type N-terminal cleavage/methylation domain-containing protein